MNNQNVILKTVTVASNFEVVGRGRMINKPCQVGGWWVMPSDQYTGKIPLDIQTQWNNFKALNIPVCGYLIADDMRDVLARREQEVEKQREREVEQKRIQDEERQKRREEFANNAKQAAEVGGKIIVGVGKVAGGLIVGAALIAVGILGAVLRYDPMLIAVLPDGRWICLGSWYD